MNKILNIWAQPFSARFNLERKRSLFLIFGFFLLVGQLLAAAMFVWSPKKFGAVIFLHAFLFSLAALCVTIFFAWFVMLVQSIGMQYSPANARLVPRMGLYLQAAIVIPIVSCAVLASAVWRLVVHDYSVWPAFICVALMVFFSIIVRTQWAVVPMILCFQVPAILDRAGFENIEKIVERNVGLSISSLLLIAIPVMIYGGMRWLFSSRDEALFAMHKRTLALRAGIASTPLNQNRVTMSLSTPFMFWMKRCLAGAQNKEISILDSKKLLGFVFGPRIHWMTISAQVVAMLATGIVAVSLLDAFAMKKESDFLIGFAFGFGGVLLIAQPLFFCFLLFYTLYQTRHEQALLRLAPTHLNNSELDRGLRSYLFQQFFILYGLSAVISVPVCIFVLQGEVKIVSLILLVCSMFPLLSAVVFDYAKMKALSDHPLLKTVMISLLIFAFGLVLGMAVSFHLLWWYSAFIIMGTFLWMRKNLRMNADRKTFPVGRSV